MRALVLACVLGAGCSPSSTARLTDHLSECGLLGPGEVGPGALAELYAPNQCYQDCLAGQACSALGAALCRTDLDALLACDQRCAARCDDGALIGPERLCNGLVDCADASDEADCAWAELRCGDGTPVRGERCDGIYQCFDGSDETGCPVDRCTDGSVIYPYERCNGWPYCSDGSDEAGCDVYRCASGQELRYLPGARGPRCDGFWSCGDGSDEAGCAMLTLSCGV